MATRSRTLLDSLPPAATIYEVSPRDGLQNEPTTVATEDKLRLIAALLDAGLRRIEATSFVSPQWIPRLADADRVARVAERRPGVVYSALCPNAQGLERAKAAGVHEIALFLSASETHNRRNVNKSIAETLAEFRDLAAAAREAGFRIRGYVSTMWACPYEGEVDPAKGLEIARELIAMGCYEVSLADTLGFGTPRQTKHILKTFLCEIEASRLALHLHDTRGMALANALVALDFGIASFDAAVAGLGGCPYTPGAAGNVATEDLVYMLHDLGVETGIDLDALVEAGRVAEEIVGRKLPGKVHLAWARRPVG